MTLTIQQQIFARNVSKLIQFANESGYEVTFGEAYRTIEQQLIYFKSGKSKTMKSSHLTRLAIDLNLFVYGKYCTTREPYKPLADFWKSLNSANVAGYDWGWDANHFEMKEKNQPEKAAPVPSGTVKEGI